jgi:hypothetical protein
MVQLGLGLGEISTALDLEEGLEMLTALDLEGGSDAR